MTWDAHAADRGDVVVIARCFAEALAQHDLDRAEALVGLAVEVAAGGWAFLAGEQRDRWGRRLCAVLTRHGTGCARLAGPDGLCSTHRSLIRGVREGA